MRALDDKSNKNLPDEELAERRRRVWLASFMPSETAIDGGLFPARLGKGMVGLEDYSILKPTGEMPDLPELDDATRQKLKELFERRKSAK